MAGPAPEPADVAITSRDQMVLRGRSWSVPDPRATLVISHGLGEHGGSYRAVAESISAVASVNVLAFDYRGHGRSPGRRGVVRAYRDLEDDLLAALDWAARAVPDRPRFLLGHSNGGLLAAKVVAETNPDLAGLILSNPALRLARQVPAWKRLTGHFLGRVWPAATLSTGLRVTGNTNDPEMVAAMLADPLRHGRINPTFFFGMIEAGESVRAMANAIRVPTLLILGGSDTIIDPATSRNFFNELGTTEKRLKLEPEMRHEPFNERGREAVVADVASWILDRLSAQA